MAAPFEALTGAAGDVKELEYISALHQTGAEVRRDASIKGEWLLPFSNKWLDHNLDRQISSLLLKNRPLLLSNLNPLFKKREAEDVSLFLMSRYGIEITELQVRHAIFAGLAGSSKEEESLE